MEFDAAWLEARQRDYLTSNYITLHNTIVSVTLAVAGIAAGNLIVVPPDFANFGVLLRVMWGVSVFATLVAFAGAATGSSVLPPLVPSLQDLLLPLLIGVSECLMFGVLGRQAQGVATPATVIEYWYYGLALYGLFAMASVWRARRIVQKTSYTGPLLGRIQKYSKLLIGDIVGAGLTSGVGIAAGSFAAAFGLLMPLWVHFSVTGLAFVFIVMGLSSHMRARRILQA